MMHKAEESELVSSQFKFSNVCQLTDREYRLLGFFVFFFFPLLTKIDNFP